MPAEYAGARACARRETGEMGRRNAWMTLGWFCLSALAPGCRLSREHEAPAVTQTAAPVVLHPLDAPPLLRPSVSPWLVDGGAAHETGEPSIPEALQRVADFDAGEIPQPVVEPVLEPPAENVAASAPTSPPVQAVPAAAELVVLATGVGIAPEVLKASSEQACRALALGRSVWQVLDQTLPSLSCAMRAGGRSPREALVMGSDNRWGAAGALPFDLDPARVAAQVRDAELGSVVAEGARALAGAKGSWDCATPRLVPLDGSEPKDAGVVALLLRDAKGAIATGLVSAPEKARPEGFLSAAVSPGDFLFARDGAAALLLGPEVRMRAQGRARQLHGRALLTIARAAPEEPLFANVQHAVWLNATQVGTLNDRVARIQWAPDAVPEVCRSEAAP